MTNSTVSTASLTPLSSMLRARMRRQITTAYRAEVRGGSRRALLRNARLGWKRLRACRPRSAAWMRTAASSYNLTTGVNCVSIKSASGR